MTPMTSRSDPYPAESGASPAVIKREAYEAMEPEEQEFLQAVAEQVRTCLTEKGEVPAATWLADQRLDMEEMLALYWLLPSHVRAALKRGARS